MKYVPSSDFQRHPATYQDAAMVAPLAITNHGRPRLVLMSIDEYNTLKRGVRKVMPVTELSDTLLQAITESKVPDEYHHLDKELDD